MLSGENLKAFSLRSRTGQDGLLSPLVFNIVPEVLIARAVRQKKEYKDTNREEAEVPALADDMTVFMREPKDSTRNPLELINIFRKEAGYKTNNSKPVAFLYTKEKHIEEEIRETILFKIASKTKIPGY